MLSDLDGFLTGIAVGPELILPSEWLPMVWGGEAPEFTDKAEANVILGSILGRYNEILRQLEAGALEPVFSADRDGTLIAVGWAEGFLQAIMLRADAWKRLFKSKRDRLMLFPILSLCSDEYGDSLLGLTPDEEDTAMEEAADFIPVCVVAIDAYWRARGSRQGSMPFTAGRPPEPQSTATNVGRNDPCPCGSGKKFKKCCASNA
jgi:uncharacterized protein